jgi:hypothetical protein
MRHKICICVAIALLAGCDRPQLTAQRLVSNYSDVFATINTGVTDGTPRSEVLVKMGVPSAMDVTAVAGVSTESLFFEDSRFRYQIRLVNGRALYKSAAPTTTDLSSK